MTERILIDWDEIDAVGPRCRVNYQGLFWPEPPSGLLAEIVVPFFRDRERYRRVMVEAVVQQMSLTGDRSTIVHQFDGGERPRLLASMITTTEGEGS